MDELGKMIIKNIAKALPELTDDEKLRVLGFSEGLSYKVRDKTIKKTPKEL